MKVKTILRKIVMFFGKTYFSKIKEDAIIPTKRDEDMGLDLYPCFEEDFILINPHSVELIPTGIASAFHKRYGYILEERGSTGSKNLKRNAGVYDSGYRNEWFVILNNANDKPLIITKKYDEVYESLKDDYIVYPYNKAIAQAIKHRSYKNNSGEISYKELLSIPSERKLGLLGSSGK